MAVAPPLRPGPHPPYGRASCRWLAGCSRRARCMYATFVPSRSVGAFLPFAHPPCAEHIHLRHRLPDVSAVLYLRSPRSQLPSPHERVWEKLQSAESESKPTTTLVGVWSCGTSEHPRPTSLTTTPLRDSTGLDGMRPRQVSSLVFPCRGLVCLHWPEGRLYSHISSSSCDLSHEVNSHTRVKGTYLMNASTFPINHKDPSPPRS